MSIKRISMIYVFNMNIIYLLPPSLGLKETQRLLKVVGTHLVQSSYGWDISGGAQGNIPHGETEGGEI